MDLYRLSGDKQDLAPLDMDNVLTNCTSGYLVAPSMLEHLVLLPFCYIPLTCSFHTSGIALIEWPSRLGRTTPTNRLDIAFRIHDDNSTEANTEDDNDIMRHITLEAYGDQWSERIKRLVDEGYVDDLLIVFNDEMN